MAIREDLVASAADFLRDPTVASSPIESRIAFLQAKNLTQEEVNAALARAGSEPATNAGPIPYSAPQQVASRAPAQPYYGQQYPPYAWQQPPPEVPRRDWRDWFIMATVVSGVGYGMYTLTKRYLYPLVAPPTPERLETDKKAIDEQFEKAFALVEQLAKDTEALKATEQQRTERLDTALSDLETVITDLKSANRRREDDAQRIRDEVQDLKASIPKALDAQKELANERLKEVNTEVSSLKTLLAQRLGSATPPTVGSGSSYLRPSERLTTVSPTASSPAAAAAKDGAVTNGATNGEGSETPGAQDQLSGPTFRSAFGLGGGSGGTASPRASIPAWQRAMEAKASPASSNGAEGSQSATAGSSAQ